MDPQERSLAPQLAARERVEAFQRQEMQMRNAAAATSRSKYTSQHSLLVNAIQVTSAALEKLKSDPSWQGIDRVAGEVSRLEMKLNEVERKSLESRRLTGGAGASSAPCTSPTTMPCGLLNHLAEESTLVVRHDARAQDVALVNTLRHLGVAPCGSLCARIHPRSR